MLVTTIVIAASVLAVTHSAAVRTQPYTLAPPAKYQLLRSNAQSALYQMQAVSGYDTPPLLVKLKGTRRQIGYDYAALLHNEASYVFGSFLNSTFPNANDQELLVTFLDFCWSLVLRKNTPQQFLDELEGMVAYHANHPVATGAESTWVVAQRFYTLANMPADPVNIIAMLEQELEQGWPAWLKKSVNEIIRILEGMIHTCDAYGVWGSRTNNTQLYTSRNLDYQSNTGMNRYKLITMFDIADPKYPAVHKYASFGFVFGPGALAGISTEGITVSEMNLDNSQVTFSGLAFPLRLRYVMETAHDLESAMQTWNATHNTNSFNFLIGSSNDAAAGNNAAYALETIRNFTAMFPANSPMEAASTIDCSTAAMYKKNKCHKWTTQHGMVKIGKPLPEAVWRSNHGFNKRVLATQEPLFHNTVYRYNLMHQLFTEYEQAGQEIGDAEAIGIVATLGIKGGDYFTCNQQFHGDNVMSIAYVPKDGAGHAYVAWEAKSGTAWRPAACAPYVRVDLNDWL